jgi:hypothetical protein
MKFKPDPVASPHEQMALVKAQSTESFSMNYPARNGGTQGHCRNGSMGPIFSDDLANLEQILRDVDHRGDVSRWLPSKAADATLFDCRIIFTA